MGGGKAIDNEKIVADRANIPVIIVPTIASTRSAVGQNERKK
jgi:glycerol dehydrogenase